MGGGASIHGIPYPGGMLRMEAAVDEPVCSPVLVAQSLAVAEPPEGAPVVPVALGKP